MSSWGRYQNDGPGLRAITLIRFAQEYLNKGGSKERVQALYDSVIKTDLDYVVREWAKPSFCLWEEVMADQFYNRIRVLVISSTIESGF
jgi:glucoamylase